MKQLINVRHNHNTITLAPNMGLSLVRLFSDNQDWTSIYPCDYAPVSAFISSFIGKVDKYIYPVVLGRNKGKSEALIGT